MRRASGFTLLELTIALTCGALTVLAAFVAVAWAVRSAGAQRRALDVVSQGRIALELIGRDLRDAGDSAALLPAPCLGGLHDNTSPWRCPAILDAHPWRVTVARSAWAPGADGIRKTTDDVPFSTDGSPDAGTAFADNPGNVVTYAFEPTTGLAAVGPAAEGRRGYRGRLVRIENPFGFGGEPAVRTVLLDDVLLDNRMVVNPADPDEADDRFSYALFLYHVVSDGSGEFQGDEALVARTTRTTAFLLPPARFHPLPSGSPPVLPPAPAVPPYRPDYGIEVAGWKETGTQNVLRSTAAAAPADLKHLLDHNRIRLVRVAFKAIAPREDPNHPHGVDLDPRTPGTAAEYPLESTFELKLFAAETRPRI